jgi:putative phosphoribosyl transferase
MRDIFRNRLEAGQLLAGKLIRHANRPNVIVLGLPRGGVPVAFEVAKALRATLDVFVVRKLGVPGHREPGHGRHRHRRSSRARSRSRGRTEYPEGDIDAVTAEEEQELNRRALTYRSSYSEPEVRGASACFTGTLDNQILWFAARKT